MSDILLAAHLIIGIFGIHHANQAAEQPKMSIIKKIRLGMSKKEIFSALGYPRSFNQDDKRFQLFYAGDDVCSRALSCYLIVENDKLVSTERVRMELID